MTVNDGLTTTLVCPKCGGPAWRARVPIILLDAQCEPVECWYAECRSMGCQHLWKLPAESDAAVT